MVYSWVEDAGHWVQQEQPETAIEQILRFLDKVSKSPTAHDHCLQDKLDNIETMTSRIC